jgi:hypothetical protein
MSIQVERATFACGTCGAQVTELRRGRCWGCYTQWSELRTVGRGAACAVCHERRRDNLRLVELHTRTLPLCYLCAGRTLRLGADAPPTLEALRALLRRNRRDNERRADGLDRRIFPRERRVGERRSPPGAKPPSATGDTDPAALMPDFDEVEIEIQEADIEVMEATSVRERPTR